MNATPGGRRPSVGTAEERPRRVYPFTYYTRERTDGRPLRSHELRDGTAAMQVSYVLYRRGYELGDVILNHPMPPGTPTIWVDDSFLKEGDLLLLTTRPPVHDELWPLRRGMPRSHTSLEEKVFTVVGRYFREVTRQSVVLEESFVRRCPTGVAQKSKIQFRQNGGASYSMYTNGPGAWRKPAHRQTTAAYMVYVEEAWAGGPDLLVIFGMGGEETLGWARFLRLRSPHLIGIPGFFMAEMVTTPAPPLAENLSYMDNWLVQLLVDEDEPPNMAA